MSRGRTASRRLFGMPGWLSDTMSAIGVTTVIYVLVKYTFVGELLERVYATTLGHSPIDELEHGLETTGNAIAADIRKTARELDGQDL